MRIIDPTTGKRITKDDKGIDKSLHKSDPITRKVEKDLEEQEHSPMDPPDAYEGTVDEKASFDDFNEMLKKFIDEHNAGKIVIDRFEKSLSTFKELGYTLNEEINGAFSEFFQFFDNKLIDHNQREEKQLFPLLHKRLIESGEHGGGDNPRTAVDMMEDDHIKFIQLGALAFNMFGLAPRLKDESSRMFVFDIAYDNSRELIEMIRLHIYREENILFPLAHKLISDEEFEKMGK